MTAQLSPFTLPRLAPPFSLARRTRSVDRLARRLVVGSTLVFVAVSAAFSLRPSAGATSETPTGTSVEAVVTTPIDVLGAGAADAALPAPTGTAFRP